MKNFNEWLKGRIDEISMSTLQSARDKASSIQGPRRNRLFKKFDNEIISRQNKEYNTSEKIKLTYEYNGKISEMNLLIKEVTPKAVGDEFKVDVLCFSSVGNTGPMPISFSVEKRTPSSPVRAVFNSVGYISASIVGFDRRGAVLLSKAINNAIGDQVIRPTDLPLE